MLRKKDKKPESIEFSIISRGTEKESHSKGYMAVTYCDAHKKRKILLVPHGVRKSYASTNCLNIKDNVSIEKIAFSRFQLISAMMYKKNRSYFDKKKDILVIGSGSVGLTACMELARQGHKKIFLLSRKDKKINLFKKIYGVDFKLIHNFKDIKKFSCIIDATGNSNVLRKIINLCVPFSTIFILGTPRKNSKVDSLMIHRKNIRLIGSHEIFGVTNKERDDLFDEIIKENKKYPQYLYEKISNTVNYSKRNRNKFIKTPKNVINIMRYI